MTETTRVADAAVQRTVTLPIGDVARMEGARRLSRERTVRSTCYTDLLASICATDRPRVDVLEALLYASAPRVDDCSREHLYLPDSRFDCSEGTIWFHYSPRQRQFVLATFELHRRGGSSGSGEGLSTLGRRGSYLNSGHGEGIAACLRDPLSASFVDGCAIGEEGRHSVANDFGPDAPWDEIAARFGSSSASEGDTPFGKSVRRTTIEIVRSCRSMRETGRELTLPRWSLLARMSLVREQFESPYARLIFAGEALCRMGEAFGRAPSALDLTLVWRSSTRRRGRPNIASFHSAVLLDESVAILDVLRDGDPARLSQRPRRCYLTASLMDRDMLADRQRLSLIRSEMTFHLARAMSDSAASRSSGEHAASAERDLLRRFALLGEFVRMSVSYFEDGRSLSLSDEGFPPDWVGGGPAAGVEVEQLRALDGFGRSASMIVDEIAPDDAREAATDSEAVHRRLLAITTEILSNAMTIRRRPTMR